MGQGDNHWCELGFAEPAVVFKGPTQTAVGDRGLGRAARLLPNCAADRLPQLPNNSPVADFRCDACAKAFELKARKGALGPKVLDGAYGAMMSRLKARNNPSLMAMSYHRAMTGVTDLIVVPKHFFTPEIIEKKNPSLPKGRSHPWIGCHILIGQVPLSGRIPLITRGAHVPKGEVLDRWRSTLFLRDASLNARGWLLAVMTAVEAVGKAEFDLDDVYAHEAALSALYPGNHNVRPKIRQQLQVLRDRGWLEFTARRGTYRRT